MGCCRRANSRRASLRVEPPISHRTQARLHLLWYHTNQVVVEKPPVIEHTRSDQKLAQRDTLSVRCTSRSTKKGLMSQHKLVDEKWQALHTKLCPGSTQSIHAKWGDSRTAEAALTPRARLHHTRKCYGGNSWKTATWKRWASRMHRTRSVFPPFPAIPCVHTTRAPQTKRQPSESNLHVRQFFKHSKLARDFPVK